MTGRKSQARSGAGCDRIRGNSGVAGAADYAQRHFLLIIRLTFFFAACSATTGLAGFPGVFDGPAAGYVSEPPIKSAPTEIMRWVWVQERMQTERRNAPVRVPVFFSAGECREPDELMVVRWPSRQAVPIQIDDVRRGNDGGVARLHLWFATDLGPGETQRWALVKRSQKDHPEVHPIPAKAADGKVRIEVSGVTAEFRLGATKGGPLTALRLESGPDLIFPEGAGGIVTLRGKTGAEDTVIAGDGASLTWGSGPVFAKVIARMRGKIGDEVEQVFRFFCDGSMNLAQSIKAPGVEEGITVKDQEFLAGRIEDAGEISIHPQPAGIVETLDDFHRGYEVDGLWGAGRAKGWLVVPGSLGGMAGRIHLEHHDQFHLLAPQAITSAEGDARPHTVRAFWSEVTFYPATHDERRLARDTLLAASQPLVAVVDRPGLDLAAAAARIEDNVREMKPVGWANETVVRHLNGRSDPFPKRNWSVEGNPAHWLEAARRANAKVTDNGAKRLAEDAKGRAAGPLDPYQITYGSSGLAWWLMRDELPLGPLASLRAQLDAVRRQLGRTDERGWPYLDVFARTQNMQMGPPFLALADKGTDPETKKFYRDQLAAPQLAAVMLHGLRPYEGRPQMKPVQSDELYQGVVDIFLRGTELVLNESLGLQPVAFGRYLDAIDVNADLYHPAHARTTELADGFAHANFFRTQSHLHRWLNWGPTPFVALLQSPVEGGYVPGSTEIWYFADALAGHWKNWPDQSWLFLAAELPQKAATYSPPVRPAPVGEVHIQHTEQGNSLTWEKAPQATAYRIYRLRNDQPPEWINSPYISHSPGEASALAWTDANGKSDDRYRIHVVDSSGRESPW